MAAGVTPPDSELIIVTIKPVPISKAENSSLPLELEYKVNNLALSVRHPTYHRTPPDRTRRRKDSKTWSNIYWQTATYGKIEYCEDEDNSFTNLETEYLTIVFDDTSDTALSCEPTVSPLDNNETDFKISFDESNNEDYMVIFDENLFSCKIISVDNLKTDSKNENDKVNMPSSLSPEPTIGYIDDLDFFKDFENRFPAIAYNDLKSKLDPLIEPSVSSRYIDKFETSLSEYDEEEQNILYFNDSFPLDVIFPNNLKMIKDNNDNIDITQPSRNMTPLPSKDQRHPWLRYQVEGYDNGIVHTYEQRLETIWGRSVNRVHVLDFASFTEGMKETLGDWLRLHAKKEMEEAGFGAYWQGSERVIPDKYLFRHAEGRKSGSRLSGGHFIGRLAAHFGLASQPPPPGPQHRAMTQRIERLEEDMRELQESVIGLRGVIESSITEKTRVST
uniref:Uncharacterized protein n=1 Tax=Tanacetum cinerariifolium TaxID=118510 RepID=A0A699GKD4_TANCI|nr:hypothetical protein [Tanacetum cinerariifolium]